MIQLPRWTTYPAVAMLGIMALGAFPKPMAEEPEVSAVSSVAPASEPSVSGPVQSDSASEAHKRVVVLGIDGMDPDTLKEVCERFPERMQNFIALRDEADGIQDLGTSTPPQSPVAWSNFITGRDPGGHGIYDFIHRDPATRGVLPSTTKSEPSSTLDLPGPYRFPLGGESDTNRTGRAFWQVLGDNGVDADVWRMPVNYPVEPAQGVSFPGMLTPALDSAYGEYTFYTTNPPPVATVNGGKVEPVRAYGNVIDTKLIGPENPFKDPRIDEGSGHAGAAERGTTAMRILIDEESRSILIEVDDQRLLLEEGEWSGFMPVTFDLMPMGLMPMSGIVRFYLRSVSPEFEMYASPINIDPASPATPVSEPDDAAANLADRGDGGIGMYYTQGMAEEVNGLKAQILSVPEFMDQVQLVYTERQRMMDYAINKYLEGGNGGFLFFYYSTVDLSNHMVWNLFDDQHPFHDPVLAAQDNSEFTGRPGSTWKEIVWDMYMRMDPVLGHLRERLGSDTTLMVMSDHGFAPYRRTFSLNTWLYENDYLVLREGLDKQLPSDHPDFAKVSILGMYDHDENPDTPLMSVVDWEKTRAYGVGFNGLYLNLKGREGCDHEGNPVEGAAQGSVDPSEAPALLAELKSKLEALTDPGHGDKRVVVRADLASEVYVGERLREAPDIQVGYNTDYENSEESTLGQIPHQVLEDNMGGSFVGSHLIAPELVSGTLLSNKKLAPGAHRLEDLTVEILAQYGIQPVDGMNGHRVLQD